MKITAKQKWMRWNVLRKTTRMKIINSGYDNDSSLNIWQHHEGQRMHKTKCTDKKYQMKIVSLLCCKNLS